MKGEKEMEGKPRVQIEAEEALLKLVVRMTFPDGTVVLDSDTSQGFDWNRILGNMGLPIPAPLSGPTAKPLPAGETTIPADVGLGLDLDKHKKPERKEVQPAKPPTDLRPCKRIVPLTEAVNLTPVEEAFTGTALQKMKRMGVKVAGQLHGVEGAVLRARGFSPLELGKVKRKCSGLVPAVWVFSNAEIAKIKVKPAQKDGASKPTRQVGTKTRQSAGSELGSQGRVRTPGGLWILKPDDCRCKTSIAGHPFFGRKRKRKEAFDRERVIYFEQLDGCQNKDVSRILFNLDNSAAGPFYKICQGLGVTLIKKELIGGQGRGRPRKSKPSPEVPEPPPVEEDSDIEPPDEEVIGSGEEEVRQPGLLPEVDWEEYRLEPGEGISNIKGLSPEHVYELLEYYLESEPYQSLNGVCLEDLQTVFSDTATASYVFECLKKAGVETFEGDPNDRFEDGSSTETASTRPVPLGLTEGVGGMIEGSTELAPGERLPGE